MARRIASAGTRLLFVLTERTDLSVLREVFEEVLPVVPSGEQPLYAEASFELTPLGRQHAVLQNLAPLSTLQLPPLLFNASGWQISPDARVLAQANLGGVSVQGPLLIVRSRNGIRTGALLGSGTWRWNSLPEDLAESDSWWPVLFHNLIQWLLAPEDDRRVRVAPTQQVFAGGESIQFVGQVYNESLQGVDNATVALDIIAPDSARFPYTLNSLSNGRYAADLGTLPQGPYTYEARATQGNAGLGTDSGNFTVGTLALEYAETRANAPLMRQIAYRSGGQFLAQDDVNTLASVLRADSAFVPRTSAEVRERALWQWPLLLAVVLVLLTAEWVLRKRVGLA